MCIRDSTGSVQDLYRICTGCGGSVQDLYRICAGSVQDLYKICTEAMLDLQELLEPAELGFGIWNLDFGIWRMRICTGAVQELYRICTRCPGSVQDLYRICAGSVQELYRSYAGFAGAAAFYTSPFVFTQARLLLRRLLCFTRVRRYTQAGRACT